MPSLTIITPGPIVSQAAVAVAEDDDVDSLRARIHEQEWRLLPEAIALWAAGRLQPDGTRVRVLPRPRLREGVG